MAIAASDIKVKLSIKTGSAGNSAAQADPNASLGKYISTTEVGTSLHDLFDAISGTENAASDVEYRCVFIHNDHGSLTAESVSVYIDSETAGGASIALAVDGTAASAIGSAGAQAEEVADESTAPSGESFSSPTTDGTGISVGDIAAGECRAIWIRRTAADTAAIDADGFTLGIAWDTAA